MAVVITQAQADAVQSLINDYNTQVAQGQGTVDQQQSNTDTIAARRDALVSMLADATISG